VPTVTEALLQNAQLRAARPSLMDRLRECARAGGGDVSDLQSALALSGVAISGP
jgi:hypothetical protein